MVSFEHCIHIGPPLLLSLQAYLVPILEIIATICGSSLQKKTITFTRMKSESGNWKFWGPKPVPFQLDNESFYLGSDVANYLKLFRGKLYSAFPKLNTKKTQPGQNREIYVSHVTRVVILLTVPVEILPGKCQITWILAVLLFPAEFQMELLD